MDRDFLEFVSLVLNIIIKLYRKRKRYDESIGSQAGNEATSALNRTGTSNSTA